MTGAGPGEPPEGRLGTFQTRAGALAHTRVGAFCHVLPQTTHARV